MVQKTQVKDTESSTESQSEIVPEASCDPSNVSIDTVQLSHVTGTKPLKQKTSQLKQRRYKLKMLNWKKSNKRRIPEEKKEEVPQNFMSQLFNFFIIFTNGMFSLLNNITSSPTGIIWGIIFILTIACPKRTGSRYPCDQHHTTNSY